MIAVRLALSGENVCVVERGAQLAAIRSKGLEVRWQNGLICRARVQAFERVSEAGQQDFFVLAVKAYHQEEVVRQLEPLVGADTTVMTLQNGIPWWYFQRLDGRFEGIRLASLEPNGELSRAIPATKIIGCVVYASAALISPGIVHHVEGNSFPVGELDGTVTKRVCQISEAFQRAGLKSRVISDIRAEIWLKAWGSLSFNPISAICKATMAEICQLPETRQLASDMMTEAQEIAEKLGITFRRSIAQRIEGAERTGAHKTSMLQDLEAGCPLESEALIGTVRELGKLTGTHTPAISTVYALLKLLEATNAAKILARPSAETGPVIAYNHPYLHVSP
jgi:ketopantoate reductase